MLLKIFWVSLFCLSGCFHQLEKYQTAQPEPSDLAERQEGPKNRVHKIRDKVYTISAPRDVTLSVLVDALMENYNINLIDVNNGILTTEWDSFYMGDRVYRNKVSVLVKGTGWGQSQLKISNNVEVLSSSANTSGKVWLPYNDKGAEEKRITLMLEDVLSHQKSKVVKPVAG